jgi:hypothetical protein
LVEITSRTNAARLYLRPSPALNLAILGILGRALALYPVTLHAFVVLSNHWHALVTPCDGEALARFMQYVHANVARAAQRINGVKGKVWQCRAQVIPVLDEAAQLARLRYVLAHGTKEQLVASPRLWPGVTAARALAGEEQLYGWWTDHELLRALRRRGLEHTGMTYRVKYPVTLAPLPVHEKLSPHERVCEVRAMLAEIEAEHPGPHLGAAAVLAQDPDVEPRRSKQSTAPAVHTTDPKLRNHFKILRAAFWMDYRTAARRHALRPTLATWPADAFLPTVHFVSQTGSFGIRMARRLARPAPNLLAQLVGP